MLFDELGKPSEISSETIVEAFSWQMWEFVVFNPSYGPSFASPWFTSFRQIMEALRLPIQTSNVISCVPIWINEVYLQLWWGTISGRISSALLLKVGLHR